MAVMGVTSILYIRRLAYEVFLKLHLAISVGIVVCLWLQTTNLSDFHTICLFVATGLWFFEKLIWLGRVVFGRLRNIDRINVNLQLSPLRRMQIRTSRRFRFARNDHERSHTDNTSLSLFQPFHTLWSDDSKHILTWLPGKRERTPARYSRF
jgi:hypothetical protein